MPPTLQFLFLLASFLCFIVAAFSVGAAWAGRINLLALGLALYIFILLVEAFRTLS